MTEQSTLKQRAARQLLSRNLKLLRADAGLSQEALADRAGLHRTYVSQVERQLVNISLDNLVLLAEALQVPLTVLLATPNKTPADATHEAPRPAAPPATAGRTRKAT